MTAPHDSVLRTTAYIPAHRDVQIADMTSGLAGAWWIPRFVRQFGGPVNTLMAVHFRRRRLRRWAKSQANRPSTITAVVGVRNRAGPRLENCLRSLSRQDCPASLLHVVLVDYGSDAAINAELRQLASAWGATLLRIDGPQAWERSRCLNAAIRRLNTKFALMVDVDLIFSRAYVSEVVRALEIDPARATYSNVWDLPELPPVEVAESVRAGTLSDLRSRAERRYSTEWLGKGIVGTYTRHLQEVGGYDEHYMGWGHEDEDLFRRLFSFGLKTTNIDSKTAYYLHQWHPKFLGEQTDSLEAPGERNREYLVKSHAIRRNDSNWGLQ